METRKVVIVGGGTVGGGVYQTIERNGGLIASRSGIQLDVASIVVRDLAKPRRVAMPTERMTTDWRGAIEDPSVDVVIELMGGLDAADEVTRRALELKKPVVTANKALLAERGAELFAIARENNANIYFEAAVAGGIPIIKALREGMVANSIDRLYGIVNGTCNYILTRMENEGADFEPILQQAQELGFAEAEPSLDVDGLDAMHKACLMASLIHGFWVSPDDIYVEGIRRIDQTDIRFARSHGYAIKLLAVIKRLNGPEGDPQIQVSVAPALVPKSNVLASVDGAFNAIFAQGDVVGDTLYYGPGAGQDPTASAVVSDIVDACLDLKHESHDRAFLAAERSGNGSVTPYSEIEGDFYIRFEAVNKSGTMAAITSVLADMGIGISSCLQPENHTGDVTPIMLMVDRAQRKALDQALETIAGLQVVTGAPVALNVEHFQS